MTSTTLTLVFVTFTLAISSVYSQGIFGHYFNERNHENEVLRFENEIMNSKDKFVDFFSIKMVEANRLWKKV